MGGWWITKSYKLTKKVKEIIMYSVYLSTEPPHLNLVLTDMDSPLVNKLMGCAKAVSDGNLKPADFLFEEMEGLRSAETSEVTKKVVRCFAEALARRVHGLHPSNPIPLLPSIEMQNPLHLFATTATNYDMLETLIIGRSKPIHFVVFSMILSSRNWRCWIRISFLLLKITPVDQYQTKSVTTRWSSATVHMPAAYHSTFSRVWHRFPIRSVCQFCSWDSRGCAQSQNK